MLARRLLIVCAVLLGLSLLAASARREPVVREDGSPGAARPAQPAESTERTVRIDADGARRRVAVDVGTPLRIEVESNEPATVQLGDDGPLDGADAGTPARFSLLPDAEGEIEVAVLDPRRVVARITVRR